MRSQERKKAGGKRKAETNYIEAYSGASQLAPPPSAKDVAALPSKLRKLIHLKASLSRGLPSNPPPLSSLKQSSKINKGRGFQLGSIPKPADHLPKNFNSVANRVDNDQFRVPSTTANLSANKSKASATGGDGADHSRIISKTAARSAKRSKSLATGRETEDQLKFISKAGDRSAKEKSSAIGGAIGDDDDDEDESGISDGMVDATKKRKKAGFASRWKRDEAELAMLVEKMDKRSKTGVSAGFGEKRKTYLKEKKKKRRKNNQENEQDDVPAMNRYEKVEFGEVVMAPPKLSFPGRAAEVKRKEKLKGEQAVSNERLRISNEKLRLDVIEAYRKQKEAAIPNGVLSTNHKSNLDFHRRMSNGADSQSTSTDIAKTVCNVEHG